MKFEKSNAIKFTQWFAYVIMYLIFTTVLYFILVFTSKLPQTWSYLHIMMITLFIVLIGRLLSITLR